MKALIEFLAAWYWYLWRVFDRDPDNPNKKLRFSIKHAFIMARHEVYG